MTTPPRIDHVTAYLAARGWTVSGRWRGADIWSRSEFDVLVPATDAVGDVVSRLRELVSCVADAEGLAPELIWREMTTPAVDVVSYRTHDAIEALTLPAGAAAIGAVSELIATTAGEALGDNRTGVRRRSDAVRLLLDRSLLSLTEDTFGLEVRLPYDDDPEPLGRRTALRMLHSSRTVLYAVNSSEVDAFEHVAREGVSGAVCRALALLAGPDREAPFDLGFRWSPLQPLDDVAVHFPPGAGTRIATIGRREEPAPDTTSGGVEGLVTGLSHDADGANGWRIEVRGIVRADGDPIGEARQSVTVLLRTADEYATALAAHRDGRVVRAVGELVRNRRRPEIHSAEQGFTLSDQIRPET
ncbi:hypothetical protein [Nocardia macrotermitis]|uniref:Uncharacterized protein n=1 Tax=Nocardia macrotermitis TaxID=2585198 RepID=A0A7K0D354_9NOCA|nr:hypothetical protein [Nocardia macrotermitis]MQY20163.1 hypothetical protein [Nocardia macrotermitis]